MSNADSKSISTISPQEQIICDNFLQQNEFFMKRKNQKEQGSKDYIRNQSANVEVLDHKFGMANHYDSSCDGKNKSGNKNYEQIQEIFVGNLSKVESDREIFFNVT